MPYTIDETIVANPDYELLHKCDTAVLIDRNELDEKYLVCEINPVSRCINRYRYIDDYNIALDLYRAWTIESL